MTRITGAIIGKRIKKGDRNMYHKDEIENGMLAGRTGDREAEESCRCAWCGGSIYAGEEYYDFDGESVCRECIDNSLRRAV